MPIIDFSTKINSKRPYNQEGSPAEQLPQQVESDRGRIINSAAIRRLQQKTQVFPLERNAAVRSRLTHSLEVQQVGRFIVQQVLFWLKRNNKIDQRSLPDLSHPMESLVEMACLMHDIGNPPFGHFGEKAISDWFAEHLPGVFAPLRQASTEQAQREILTDLSVFEGNSQAIRLVHSLLNLNLTYTQTAAILKYTRPAFMSKAEIPADKSYLMKKPGFYLSEKPYIHSLRQALELEEGCRHPLSYIMEAADDISYCFADIEDAVEKGILNIPQLCDLLRDAYLSAGGNPEADELYHYNNKISLIRLLEDALGKYERERIDKANQFFISLRVKLQHILVNHAARRFDTNFEAIFNGTFNQALLEDDSPAHKLAESFKSVALAHVFSHPEVETQELRGHHIIQGLLDYYSPLLHLSQEDFLGLMNKNGKTCRQLAREARLINKLPAKHRRAYAEAVENLVENEEQALWERYYRCRLMQDFISGMTDQFAFDEYKSLTVQD